MSRRGGWWNDPRVPFDPARCPFFYGWVIVAAATMGIVFSIPGQTMGFSVFTNILIRELGLTRVQLSAAYCVGTVMSGLTLPLLGRLFDRFGARRMVVASAATTGVVLLYLSQLRWVLAFLNQLLGAWVSATVLSFLVILIGFYLIRAAAQGVLTMTSRNVVGKWFDYHRGTALALSGVVTSFAFSIAPWGLNRMIGWFDWDGAWFVMGVATLVVMVSFGWVFFRDNPEECGLVMDGVAHTRERKAHVDTVIFRDYTREEAMRTWSFWVFNLTFVFIAYLHTAFTFHIESIGEAAGRKAEEVFALFVPMSVVSVSVNLLSGWLSPRTRLKVHVMAMNVATLVGVIGLVALESAWGKWALVLGNGVAGGFFAALTGIVWPRFFGRRFLGAISGVAMASMVIASGVGPLLFGMAYQFSGSYDAVLAWSCLWPAALVIGAFWADNPQRKGDE